MSNIIAIYSLPGRQARLIAINYYSYRLANRDEYSPRQLTIHVALSARHHLNAKWPPIWPWHVRVARHSPPAAMRNMTEAIIQSTKYPLHAIALHQLAAETAQLTQRCDMIMQMRYPLMSQHNRHVEISIRQS